MNSFTNTAIDINTIPSFQQLKFLLLEKRFFKVIVLNTLLLYAVLGVALAFVLYFKQEFLPYLGLIISVYLILLVSTLFLCNISFNKRGYIIREFDIIYRSGILATNTMIVPFSRIQHVAIHESAINRFFGLAKIEVFTAGGISSDLAIPGLNKDDAERINQFLLSKIAVEI